MIAYLFTLKVQLLSHDGHLMFLYYFDQISILYVITVTLLNERKSNKINKIKDCPQNIYRALLLPKTPIMFKIYAKN